MSTSVAGQPVLTVRGVEGPSVAVAVVGRDEQTHHTGTTPSWTGLDLDVYAGDVVLLRGPSGVGKSTLLKVIANVQSKLEIGESNTEIRLNGRLPYEGPHTTRQANCSAYRTQVLYVGQRPPLMEGTPDDTLHLVRSFAAQQKRSVLHWPTSILSSVVTSVARIGVKSASAVNVNRTAVGSYGWSIVDQQQHQPSPSVKSTIEAGPANVHQIIEALGLKDYHWTQNWNTLSGGEAQRMSIGVALSMALPDSSSSSDRSPVCVFLLDEPTSALDTQSAQSVEKLILLSKAYRHIAVVWITHSDEQANRVTELCGDTRRVRILNLGTGPTS